jgi:cytochrome c oxidase subunit 2
MSRRGLAALLLGLGLGACALPAPAADTQAAAVAQGRTLFVDKGCATCHAHQRSPVVGVAASFGPNLSTYRNDPVFLRSWLKDPRSVRPATQMPALKLSDVEIEALIAFINAEP